MAECLAMAERFHTGVDWWLSLPLEELQDWIVKAGELKPQVPE